MQPCTHENAMVQGPFRTVCRETGYCDEWFSVYCFSCMTTFTEDEWCEELGRTEHSA